jgi:uncharacterized protein involved in exopolysaccharide biosynthesis
MLSQRVKPASEDLTGGDLQQLVGRVLSILRYRRWLFALPLLTGIMAVLAVGLLVPRQYVLRTVFERRDDPVLLKLVANSPFSVEIQRQALRFNVTGHGAVREAIEQSGLDYAGLSPEQAQAREQELTTQFTRGLQIGVINSGPNHDLIEMKYTGGQPELAQKVVSTLRDNYIQRTRAAARDMQQQAQQFFSDEVEKRRNLAVRMQAELNQVVISQPEVDPRRPDWLHERLLAENLALEQLNREKQEILTDIQARRDYLMQIDEHQAKGNLPARAFATQVIDSPQRRSIQAQISRIEGELTDARIVRRMKDTHPHVDGLIKKLEQLSMQLEQVGQEIASSSVEPEGNSGPWDHERNRIEMELKTFQGKLEQVELAVAARQTAKDRLDGQKSTVFERQQAHMLRQHELENVKAELNIWRSKLEEINRVMAAENVDRGVRFTTIEECRLPIRPNSPKLQATLLLSGGVGLALAIVAVFLRELFDRSLRSPERVSQLLGIPVLETIGEILVRPSPRRWLTKYLMPATAVVQACVVLSLGWLLYLNLEHPHTYARWVETLGSISVANEHPDAKTRSTESGSTNEDQRESAGIGENQETSPICFLSSSLIHAHLASSSLSFSSVGLAKAWEE